MPLLCISPSLNAQTPVYPGDTPFSVTWEAGTQDDFTLSTFSMSPHVGAHMDAPKHRAGRLPDITEIPLDAGVGPAWVCDVSAGMGAIDSDAFESVPKDVTRLLIKTGRPEGTPFSTPYRALTKEAVLALKARGLTLIGIDAPGLDAPGKEVGPDSAHSQLLPQGVVFLENLVLAAAPEGPCELIALPLKMTGLEASPVRAVLRF